MWRGWMNEYLLLAAHLFLLQGGHGVHLASSASRHGSCQVFMVYSSSFQRLIVGCLSLTGCWLALVLESYGLLWVPPGTWLFLQNVLPVLLSFSSQWVSSCAIISLKLIVHRGSFFGEHTIYFLGLLLCCLISSMVRPTPATPSQSASRSGNPYSVAAADPQMWFKSGVCQRGRWNCYSFITKYFGSDVSVKKKLRSRCTSSLWTHKKLFLPQKESNSTENWITKMSKLS